MKHTSWSIAACPEVISLGGWLPWPCNHLALSFEIFVQIQSQFFHVFHVRSKLFLFPFDSFMFLFHLFKVLHHLFFLVHQILLLSLVINFFLFQSSKLFCVEHHSSPILTDFGIFVGDFFINDGGIFTQITAFCFCFSSHSIGCFKSVVESFLNFLIR